VIRSVLLLAVLACACATSSSSSPGAGAASTPASAATATLEARSDSTTSGTARFTAAAGALAVHLDVQGATPGEHGVHIHEKGDCSDPKATSAGGHFNPNAGAHHGGPTTDPRHGGDLGNMTADASGKGTLDVMVAGLSLDGQQNGVIGRSIVVHEKADDLQSDPAGNSGARVACGVIQAAR
jgi:Cu-Zn family superoxide dismutase